MQAGRFRPARNQKPMSVPGNAHVKDDRRIGRLLDFLNPAAAESRHNFGQYVLDLGLMQRHQIRRRAFRIE
jgi:hypothetical protein